MEKNKILIEVAANHPLIHGKPSLEFEERLKVAIKIYKAEELKGNYPIIYVPGSIHSVKKNGEWITDENSLSKAGEIYLIEHGISPEHIRGEKENARFMKTGVYNSGDECLVASKIANEEEITNVKSIVSPVQVYRKSLFYIRQGISPEMYGVGIRNTAHNYVGEAFWSLFITYFIDHTWQNSFMAYKTREERNRNFEITSEIQQIIDSGIVIPPKVAEEKKRMMSLYNNALSFMENKRKNSIETLFSIDSFDDKSLSLLENLLSEYTPKDKITICISITSKSDIEKVSKISKLSNSIVINNSLQSIINFYKKGSFADWHHITPSPNTMVEAITAIKQGCIPILHSVPSERNDPIEYINQINHLYETILALGKIPESSSSTLTH